MCYSLLLGTGIGFAAAPLMPVATRWFPKKTGFAVSVVAMGSSLGVMAGAPRGVSLPGGGLMVRHRHVLRCGLGQPLPGHGQTRPGQ